MHHSRNSTSCPQRCRAVLSRVNFYSTRNDMRSNPRTISRSMKMTTHQEIKPKPSAQSVQPPYKILRLKQVLECTGLSRSTVYDLLDKNSPRHDPSFPRSIHLTQSSIGWLESEMQTWIESRITKSRR
ncbi:helix-turn-helix transcriptional regulator [Aquirhabdus sp.]|uniref:helix-turn-helix transcriptional regulator n=1 Tax=Aquirhabdus sp. TaxID=2824160 RepID=UPI00396C51DC